jgi:hypothetical protein
VITQTIKVPLRGGTFATLSLTASQGLEDTFINVSLTPPLGYHTFIDVVDEEGHSLPVRFRTDPDDMVVDRIIVLPDSVRREEDAILTYLQHMQVQVLPIETKRAVRKFLLDKYPWVQCNICAPRGWDGCQNCKPITYRQATLQDELTMSSSPEFTIEDISSACVRGVPRDQISPK